MDLAGNSFSTASLRKLYVAAIVYPQRSTVADCRKPRPPARELRRAMLGVMAQDAGAP